MEFREVGRSELGLIAALAQRIWPLVYPEMIGEDQIRYMLREMNSVSALRESAEQKAERFWLLEVEGEAIGYFAIEPRAEGVAFLDKLYLLPEFHGQGLGHLALAQVRKLAEQMDCARIELRVNRANAKAIRCYARNGYTVQEESCVEIGGGFVMDDYVMGRPV